MCIQYQVSARLNTLFLNPVHLQLVVFVSNSVSSHCLNDLEEQQQNFHIMLVLI
jgi:hypothetical protein